MRSEFDEFASSYSRTVDEALLGGQRHGFFLDAKARVIEGAFATGIVDRVPRQGLEIGCGPGLMRERLQHRFARLLGVDTSLAGLFAARRRDGLVAGDGRACPFADASFDVVYIVCVLHHVAPVARQALANEMARLVRPGGLVAVCEHNPWNPLTRHVVNRCAFDRDAILLRANEAAGLLRDAGLTEVESRYLLFTPWRGAFWAGLDSALRRLPLGAQYATFGKRATTQTQT